MKLNYVKIQISNVMFTPYRPRTIMSDLC